MEYSCISSGSKEKAIFLNNGYKKFKTAYLLLPISSNRAEQLISEMIKNNIDAKIIGEVIDNDNKSSKIIVG